MWRSTWRQERHHLILSDVVPKNTPKSQAASRVGLTEIPEITEIRSLASGGGTRGLQPTGAHVLSDRRGEHKARFIDENQVGAQP